MKAVSLLPSAVAELVKEFEDARRRADNGAQDEGEEPPAAGAEASASAGKRKRLEEPPAPMSISTALVTADGPTKAAGRFRKGTCAGRVP